MSVEGGVTGSARELFVLFECYVLFGSRVYELFGESQIDQVEDTWVLFEAHEEVVWLDIPMHELFIMHVLQPIYELSSKH